MSMASRFCAGAAAAIFLFDGMFGSVSLGFCVCRRRQGDLCQAGPLVLADVVVVEGSAKYAGRMILSLLSLFAINHP
jgi:hypothetical protein